VSTPISVPWPGMQEVTFDESAVTISNEPASAFAASTIAGAVFDATGKPPRRLPLRPDLIKRLMSA
jgi:hypothetical protein